MTEKHQRHLAWLREAEHRILSYLSLMEYSERTEDEAHELVKHLLQVSNQILQLENM